MKYLMLDTSGYSAFKRGHTGAIAAIRSAAQILLPTIALGELLAGFEAGSRPERNREELDAFMDSLRVSAVPIGPSTAERYAHIYAYLRSVGRPIPTNDLWIAASAMEHGAELLSADTHFDHVSQIIVHQLSP